MKGFKSSILMLQICVIITSCNVGGFPSGWNTLTPSECEWRNDIATIYENVYLLKLPQSNNDLNESTFQNAILESVINLNSLQYMMDNVQGGFNIANSFDFKWAVTRTSTTRCNGDTESTKSLTLTQDDYSQYFTSSNTINNSPRLYVDNNANNQYKFELTFQLRDVENWYDGTNGTLIWTQTWNNPFTVGVSEWVFLISDAIVVQYNPAKSYLSTRKIYIYGQFEEIPMQII